MKSVLSLLCLAILATNVSAVNEECKICQDFTMLAELFVQREQWNATDILDNANRLCEALSGELGPNRTADCIGILDAAGADFAACIASAGNVTTCCQSIPGVPICESSVAVSAPIRVQVGNISECQICRDFVAVAEILVKREGWNESQIIADADKLCDLLGSASTECKLIVNFGGKNFAKCIVGGNNDTQCCQDIPEIKICSNQDELEQTPCETCQEFVQIVEVLVKREGLNASEILDDADKICSLLGKEAVVCDAIVVEFGKQLITCIAAQDNTTQCCNDLPVKICPTNLPKLATPAQDCQICKEFATAAGVFTRLENWNASDVLNSIEDICAFTGTLSGTCKSLVESIGTPLAECITSNPENATLCCQELPDLNICGAPSRPAPRPMITVAVADKKFKKAVRIN